MTNRKHILILSILFLTYFCCALDNNIIKNGSFEVEQTGYTAQWSTEAFLATDDAVRFYTSDQEKYEGEKSFGIANIEPNDSKIIQWVEVESDSLYKLSCMINAKNITGASVGANISVLGVRGSSRSLKDTGGEWEYVEVYGKTGPDQKELAVVARLGFYGNLVTGIVYFDDFRMEKVKKAPTNIVLNFYSSEEKVVLLDKEYVQDMSLSNSVLTIFIIIICSLGIIVAAIFLYMYVIRRFWGSFLGYLFKTTHKVLKKEQNERRKSTRRRMKLKVIIKLPTRTGGYKELFFHSLDLSLSGMFIRIDDLSFFKVGKKLDLSIENKGRIKEMGQVLIVRTQKELDRKGLLIQQGIGVQFLTQDDKIREWLNKLINIPGRRAVAHKSEESVQQKKSANQNRETDKNQIKKTNQRTDAITKQKRKADRKKETGSGQKKNRSPKKTAGVQKKIKENQKKNKKLKTTENNRQNKQTKKKKLIRIEDLL